MTLETASAGYSLLDSFKDRFALHSAVVQEGLRDKLYLPSFFEEKLSLSDRILALENIENGQAGQDGIVKHDFSSQLHELTKMHGPHEVHEVNIFPPIVLGVGYGKLRHKLAALLHQFRLEVGNSPRSLQQYCRNVISICSDQGTEAGLYSAPDLDFEVHLKNESLALTDSCGKAGEGILADLHVPDCPASQNDLDPVMSLALVARLFPNCLFIPGIKHSMDNLLNDTWNSMAHKTVFLTQLKAFDWVLSQDGLRDKMAYLFFSAPEDFVFSERLKYWNLTLRSLRWHAVIAFIQKLRPLAEGLRRKWRMQTWMSQMPAEHHDAEGRGP